jgi:hypothetical protein
MSAGATDRRSPFALIRRHPLATAWGLVVFLVLSAGGVTWAVWTAQSTISATATSGGYGVTQTGLATLQADYTAASPTKTTGLVITNTGTTRSTFTYSFTVSDASLGPAFTSTTWPTSSASLCTASATPPPSAVVTSSAVAAELTATLDANSTATFCVRERLSTTAPTAAYGATLTLTGTASTGSGTWAKTATATAALRPIDDVAPSASTVTFSKVAATTVQVGWTAATDNAGVTSYRVYRDNALVTTVSPDSTSWVDDTLLPSTAYAYKVEALDAAGNAKMSAPASITTPAGTYYRFVSLTYGRCLNVSGSSTTSGAGVSLATCGTTTNSQGWGIAPRTDESVRLYPKHATAMRLGAKSTAAGTSPVILSSAAAANDRWQVRTNADGTVNLFNVAANRCLSADTSSAVRLQNCDANSAAQKFGFRSFAPDTTAPVAPTVTVTAVTSSTVDLRWADATDDVAVVSYVIKRGGTTIATVGPLVSTYTVTTGTRGATDYTFTVTAVDAAGNATTSSSVSATTPGPVDGATYELISDGQCVDVSGASTSSGTSVIGWSCHDGDNQQWIVSYLSDGTFQLSPKHAPSLKLGASASTAGSALQVLSGSAKNARWIASFAADGTATLTNADTDLCLGTSGAWTGSAAQLQTCSDASGQRITLRAGPTAPGAPSISTSATTATSTKISWTPADGTATGYRVYRDDVLVSSLGSDVTSWTDDALIPTTTYRYQVEAVNAIGATKSATGNATTSAASYFRAVAIGDNRCVDVSGVSTQSGAAVYLWDCIPNQENQAWSAAPLNDGTLRLFPKHAPSLRLGASSSAAGTGVSVLSAADAANARWTVRTNADGTIGLVNVDANKCLAADSGSANGRALRLQTCDANDSVQKFRQQTY